MIDRRGLTQAFVALTLGVTSACSSRNNNSEADVSIAVPTPITIPLSTETQIPTLEPTITPTPVPTEEPAQYYDNAWTGELPLNNIMAIPGKDVAEEVVDGLLKRNADTSKPSRLDSTLTSLTNKFSPILFGEDPLTEPGFGQTTKDIANILPITDIISNRGVYSLSDLLGLNDGGIITSAVVGSEDDRDAALAVLAAELAFVSRKLDKINGTNSLEDVFNDPKAVATVSEIQKKMFAMIQEEGLGVSGQEIQQRETDGGLGNMDASAGIPVALQSDDQSLSCDVYRTPAVSRENQLQSLRQVAHEVDAKDTFTKANSSKEQTIWVWAYNPATGEWKTGAFTLRAYVGPVAGQEGSASGEQKLPCGKSTVINSNEATPSPKKEKGPNPNNGTDRGTGGTSGETGTGNNEH